MSAQRPPLKRPHVANANACPTRSGKAMFACASGRAAWSQTRIRTTREGIFMVRVPVEQRGMRTDAAGARSLYTMLRESRQNAFCDRFARKLLRGFVGACRAAAVRLDVSAVSICERDFVCVWWTATISSLNIQKRARCA
jgi:hypothetical protein